MSYKIGARVHVQLAEDESWNFGVLIGLVDLRTDPDFLALEEILEDDDEVPEAMEEMDKIIQTGAEEQGISAEEFLEELMKDVPKIKLDDGRIIFGSQCYWYEISEQEEQPLRKEDALFKAATSKLN